MNGFPPPHPPAITCYLTTRPKQLDPIKLWARIDLSPCELYTRISVIATSGTKHSVSTFLETLRCQWLPLSLPSIVSYLVAFHHIPSTRIICAHALHHLVHTVILPRRYLLPWFSLYTRKLGQIEDKSLVKTCTSSEALNANLTFSAFQATSHLPWHHSWTFVLPLAFLACAVLPIFSTLAVLASASNAVQTACCISSLVSPLPWVRCDLPFGKSLKWN